jgi:hypothetical protein
MKLRNMILAIGVVGLLAPASLLAEDAAATPATTTPATAAPAEKSADNTAAPKEEAKEAEKPAAKAKPKSSALCARSTGSILRPSPKSGCTASTQPMRTFTQDDIARTGEMNVASALRKLDPSIH